MARHALIILTALIALAIPAGKAETSVGVSTGYVTHNESMSIGLGLNYSFTSHFRLNPQVDYIFKHKQQDGILFNIDMEMPYGIAGSKANVYPLVGFSYTSWNQHFSEIDTSQRTNKLGLNLGAGVEYMVKPSLKLFLEGRCNLVKHFSTGLFTVGIAYVF